MEPSQKRLLYATPSPKRLAGSSGAQRSPTLCAPALPSVSLLSPPWGSACARSGSASMIKTSARKPHSSSRPPTSRRTKSYAQCSRPSGLQGSSRQTISGESRGLMSRRESLTASVLQNLSASGLLRQQQHIVPMTPMNNYGMFDLTTAIEMLVSNKTEESLARQESGNERYLNLFRMLKSKDVLHQLAAAVRGGPIDPECTGYPCASRFGRFFSQYANKDGELCTKEFGNIASNVYHNGYHGVAADKTLFKEVAGLTFREDAAMAGFHSAFGTKRGDWPKSYSAGSSDICMPLADAKWLEMEGTFPKDWVKPNGCCGVTDLGPIFEVWRKMSVKGLSRGVLGVSVQFTIQKMAASALEKSGL